MGLGGNFEKALITLPISRLVTSHFEGEVCVFTPLCYLFLKGISFLLCKWRIDYGACYGFKLCKTKVHNLQVNFIDLVKVCIEDILLGLYQVFVYQPFMA